MFDEILRRMREKIRSRQYVMTLHAEEEMSEDGLTIYDIEQGILTGEILERQRDRVTAESKYHITGTTVDGGEVEIIAKLSPAGKVVIIDNCQAKSGGEGRYYYSICTLKPRKSQMVCDICGSEGVIIRKITRAYGKDEDLLVIENIPIISCPHCGESYFTAETLHEIDRIKLNRKTLAVERPVEVASFA